MPRAFESSSVDKTAQGLAAKARSLAKPPFWYSFEYGMAHIVVIDTDTDFTKAPYASRVSRCRFSERGPPDHAMAYCGRGTDLGTRRIYHSPARVARKPLRNYSTLMAWTYNGPLQL